MTGQAAPLKDSAAFSQLFERTHVSVYRFIYSMHGGTTQDAEDLTAETYTRAWKARQNFLGNEQAAIGWLFTIARRLVIDQIRRRKARGGEPVELQDYMLDLYLIHPDATPEEHALAEEQLNRIWILMQDLPDDRREMLVLRYMLGWPVNQIAGFLDLPENTVSVYIRRSLDQIRNSWQVEK